MGARKLLIDTCAVIVGIPVAGLIVLGVARPQSSQLAAVFPPWWPSVRTIVAAASAGRVVALGRVPGTVIVHGDAGSLAGRLRAAGAVFLVDTRFSAGCSAASTEIAR